MKKNELPGWIKIGTIASLIVTVICVIGWIYRSNSEGSFTIINSIFSGLAFVGLIIAIFMQREELELQRQELLATRAEFAEQNYTLKHQRFESTFFNLLNNFIACQEEKDSKEYFKLWSELGTVLNDPQAQQKIMGGVNSELDAARSSALLKYTNSFFNGEIKSFLGVYLMNLFNVLKYIENSSLIDVAEKEFYADVLFTQISDIELALIAHHLLIAEQDQKAIELAKKYKMLRKLDVRFYIYEYFTRLFKREGYDLW